MKFYAVLAVLVLTFLAVANAQYRRRYRVIRPLSLPNRGERYAASLGGAPVGTYGKSRDFISNSRRRYQSSNKRRGYQLSNKRGGYQSSSEVFGESLGNSKVGLYGNDRTSGVWKKNK